MNANELANELQRIHNEDIVDGVAPQLVNAIAMLRKQQAVLIAEQEHNEMLEAELKAMREQLNANQV